MDSTIEIALIEEAKENKNNRTTSLGDTEHKSDIAKYLEPDRFQSELSQVFNKLPSILIHSSELEKPDSFQAVSTTLGQLLASRDSDGNAHVFYNACRHRGAKLVDGKGCSKRLICPYHAWTYTTDGKLAGVPDQKHCFPNLDPNENSLVEIPSVERYGFVWICPDVDDSTQVAEYLDNFLGEMTSHLEWMAADSLKFFKRTNKEWQANWKLFAEGGLETYHFAMAHRETIAPYFYNNIAVIDAIGQHFRVVMPTRELENEEVDSLHDCSHTLFYLLPNSAVLIQKEHVDWIRFRPISEHITEISVTTLIPKSTDLSDEKQLEHWQKNHQITNVTLDEDWSLGESIHESLRNNALPYIQYGKNEWALQALNERLNEYLQID